MLRNVMYLSRRKKLARLHKSTIALSPDPLPSSEGLASETINVHLPYGGTAANLRSLFRGRKLLKWLKGLTVGQALPEIRFSVGSKLDLPLGAFGFAKFPYTFHYPEDSIYYPDAEHIHKLWSIRYRY